MVTNGARVYACKLFVFFHVTYLGEYTYRRYGTGSTGIFKHLELLVLASFSVCPFVTEPKPAALDLVANVLDALGKIAHIGTSHLPAMPVSEHSSQHNIDIFLLKDLSVLLGEVRHGCNVVSWMEKAVYVIVCCESEWEMPV